MYYGDDGLAPYRLSTTTSSSRKRKRARSPARDIEFEPEHPDMVRAPKRLRRLAVRNASFPTAAVAVRSWRAERLARRKSEHRACTRPAAVGWRLAVGNGKAAPFTSENVYRWDAGHSQVCPRLCASSTVCPSRGKIFPTSLHSTLNTAYSTLTRPLLPYTTNQGLVIKTDLIALRQKHHPNMTLERT